MKLHKVQIHNFRGILDAEVILKDYSLLVGPNNAGKSTVIDAIRAFYEKDGFKFRETDFPVTGAKDDDSWVELTFKLSPEEWNSLQDDYKVPSRELRLRKWFKRTSSDSAGRHNVGYIYAYKAVGSLSESSFYGAKNVQSGKLGDLIYIPAISTVDEQTKLTGPSALRDLLASLMNEVVERSEAYASLTKHVEAFATLVRETETSDGRSLSRLEKRINSLLSPWGVNFSLRIITPDTGSMIKSMVTYQLTDSTLGRPQPVELYGSGFQRHFIYSLIRLGSEYVGHKVPKKTKDFTPSFTLLLFEEPEAFLHPPQQRELAASLMELAASEDWQVICATHSAHFVSRNALDIPSIIRFRRYNGIIEKYQIGPEDWNELVDANQQLNKIAAKYPNLAKRLRDIDWAPEMEAIKYFLWLNPDRASAFFADLVLLVEGPTEVALVNRLVAHGRIQTEQLAPGLHVLDCMGKYNIHRFMNLFSRLGIPHGVLFDDDHGRAEHAEINQLINDSVDQRFTIGVQQIKGNLESFLGLKLDGDDHAKPQRVLYLYETGQIDSDRIKAFCELVSACLCGRSLSQDDSALRSEAAVAIDKARSGVVDHPGDTQEGR
jgi:predicted ATP-dependent endonuclease of OLD family